MYNLLLLLKSESFNKANAALFFSALISKLDPFTIAIIVVEPETSTFSNAIGAIMLLFTVAYGSPLTVASPIDVPLAVRVISIE